ncbi:uncharacterized protein LOC115817284 [Chanos chanos]|uniref:Uncharacterized protein LOC115817284 n=1 Tax=Chanos chanos TaxID=29144 RepID=A0A6J2VWW0_CHACN|nr:uncharacterized protein LOC115817284 [Chanos chanos]
MSDPIESGTSDVVPPADGPQNPSSGTPLVEVTFQKTEHKHKYLEAEPKILGITQIMLSVFQILSTSSSYSWLLNVASPLLSIPVIIAGSVTLAAQNLHLPTIKACLAMQVLACVASVFNFLLSTMELSEGFASHICWMHENGTEVKVCRWVTSVADHLVAGEMLVLAAQIAISATVAAYCCKVVQCCSPRAHMPVITVTVPPAPQ